MFCVNDIFQNQYPEFGMLQLIAGNEGLNREITRPNTILTLPVSDWLQPGEMIIFSGIGMEVCENTLLELVDEAAHGDASCIMIMLSEQHIPMISERVIERANAWNIPLLTAPWEVHLGPLMGRISTIIEMHRLKDEVLSQLLFELLSQDADSESCIERARLYGHNLERPHRVAVLKIDNMRQILDQRNYTDETQIYEYKNRIRRDIECCLLNERVNCICVMRKSSFVIIMEMNDLTKRAALDQLITIATRLRTLHAELQIRVGFSRICSKVEDYARGFKEARSALELQPRDEMVVSYEESGILPRLISCADQETLRAMYEETVGRLMLADRENNLLGTLEVYLEHNCNAMQTAQTLYIHRNSLINRIDKIEELLDVNLDDAYTRNNLFNALLVRKYL